jgi:NADPH-dependent 2,4-dienoyl-CoA reductase/sulfur reductase-like enzyme
MMHRYEAVIVGMGPAGLAAAAELVRAGVRTALIDQAPSPGGQVYRQPPAGFHLSPGLARSRHQRGKALLRELGQSGSLLTLLQGSIAWGAFAHSRLSLHLNGRQLEIGYDRLLICEGAQERVVPCPGWTLPGVFTLGGLQKTIVSQGIAPRGRVLLAGSGPLMMGTGAALTDAGVRLVGWYEAVPMVNWLSLAMGMLRWPRLIPESLSYLRALLVGGVRPHFSWGLKALFGDARVWEATLVRLDGSGEPMPGSEKSLPVDVVGIGFGLQPSIRLSRLIGCQAEYDPVRRCFIPTTDYWGQSSLPGVYLAGDGAGVGGADWSEVQGRLAGLHAAWSLNHTDCKQLDEFCHGWARAKRKIEAYLVQFHKIFTPLDGHYRAITPETVICRCEGVTAGELSARMKLGERDLTALKPTRLGMGPCQGRGCEAIAAELLRLDGVAPETLKPLNLRPPLIPMPLSAFGGGQEKVPGFAP